MTQAAITLKQRVLLAGGWSFAGYGLLSDVGLRSAQIALD
jgi:hypothetical protein